MTLERPDLPASCASLHTDGLPRWSVGAREVAAHTLSRIYPMCSTGIEIEIGIAIGIPIQISGIVHPSLTG